MAGFHFEVLLSFKLRRQRTDLYFTFICHGISMLLTLPHYKQRLYSLSVHVCTLFDTHYFSGSCIQVTSVFSESLRIRSYKEVRQLNDHVVCLCALAMTTWHARGPSSLNQSHVSKVRAQINY